MARGINYATHLARGQLVKLQLSFSFRISVTERGNMKIKKKKKVNELRCSVCAKLKAWVKTNPRKQSKSLLLNLEYVSTETPNTLKNMLSKLLSRNHSNFLPNVYLI